MIDKILTDIVKRDVPDEVVAVLLSGGVDSLSLAFTAHRLGKTVHAYTFHLVGQPTYDSEKANAVCEQMGWQCTTVQVPVTNLYEDFMTLKTAYNCIKKTQFECTFPFLYIYPLITEKYILSGIAADGHYGVSKKAMIHFKEPKELFDQFREDYFTQKNPAGLLQQLALASVHGKRFVYPYCDPEVVTYFRGFDWYGLNKPHQKHHVLTAYPEFASVGRPKHHINLQLGSGIDIAFEALLSDNRINFMQRGRMLEVYRGWEDHLPSEPMVNFE